MTLHIKHGGAWREPTEVHVKHAGAWRDVQEVHVKHAGSWRKVFTAEALALPASITSSGFDVSSPYNALAGVKVDTDGYMYRLVTNSWSQVSGAQYWISNKSATMSNYECQLVRTSGVSAANLYGLNLSTYYTLSSDRAWGIDRTSAGNEEFHGTLYIREKANTSNVVTCSISLYADAGFL